MGGRRFAADDYVSYASATKSKSRDEIFTTTAAKVAAHGLDPILDPLKFKIRECVDSPENPNAFPIILASDVTGSMGALAEQVIKKDLGDTLKEIYDRKPVEDPQVCYMAFGDTYYDCAPLQMTHFEPDIVVHKQMEKIYIEGGGGGNEGESYLLPWYMAAFRTKCDHIIKGRGKGFLFTIGDEPPLLKLPKEHIKRFLGDDVQQDFTAKELLEIVSEGWEVYHFVVKEVAHSHSHHKKLLGQRAIYLEDHTKLSEAIVSIIQVAHGAAAATVAASWGGDTSMTIKTVLEGLPAVVPTRPTGSTGVVRL